MRLPRKRYLLLAIAVTGFGTWYLRPKMPEPERFRYKWPYPGIAYQVLTRKNPEQRIFVARIDLANSRVRVRVVPAGPDPDGKGPWQTRLMQPSAIAGREGLEFAVNGDFFQAKDTRDVEGIHSAFVSGKWALARGPAMTDGRLWATPVAARPALLIDRQGKGRMEPVVKVPADSVQAIGGSLFVLKAGGLPPLNASNYEVHPRTLVGLTADGKTLVVAVVDGRRPGWSRGMTLTEAGYLMWQLKCRDAINLDGGGSREMLFRDPKTKAYRVVNWPSDGRERAVANVLGVEILPEKNGKGVNSSH